MVEIIQMILLNLFMYKKLFSNNEKTRDDLNPFICFLNHELHELNEFIFLFYRISLILKMPAFLFVKYDEIILK